MWTDEVAKFERVGYGIESMCGKGVTEVCTKIYVFIKTYGWQISKEREGNKRGKIDWEGKR